MPVACHESERAVHGRTAPDLDDGAGRAVVQVQGGARDGSAVVESQAMDGRSGIRRSRRRAFTGALVMQRSGMIAKVTPPRDSPRLPAADRASALRARARPAGPLRLH